MAGYDSNAGNFDNDANRHSINVNIGDPGGDLKVPIFRFPSAGRLRAAYAVSATTLAAGTANYYSVGLYNGGTSGTAETSVATAAGGTAAGGTAAAWTLCVPKTITLTAGSENFSAGQWVVVDYAETGTVAENISVQVDYSLTPA